MYNWFLWIIFFLTPPSLVLAEIKTYEGTYTSTISYEVSQTFAGSIEILGDYPTPGMPELSVRVQVNDGFQFIGFGETTNNEQGGVIDHGDGTFTIPEISINGILTAYFSPNIIFVDDNATEGGDGSSWSTAHKYLQDALAAAEYGDEIWVAEGTYKPDQGAGKTAGDRTASFNLVSGVRTYGGFIGSETSRYPQGENIHTILSGEINEDIALWSLNVVSGINLDVNTSFVGFVITKGNANGSTGTVYENGGGIKIADSNFSISDCVITYNDAAGNGAGMLIETGSYLTLNNCLFTHNNADGNGSGMLIETGSYLTLNNCLFTHNNAAGNGAGIYSSSAIKIDFCVFELNEATNGAGVYTSSSLDTTGSVFEGNSCYQSFVGGKGGGVYTSSDAIFQDCTFIYNSAKGDHINGDTSGGEYGGRGGGIWSSLDSNLTITDCVFDSNIASYKGGGINAFATNGDHNFANGDHNLTSCIFTKNSALYGGGIFSSGKKINLINCAFAENSATVGGGIYLHSESSSLTNCIFTKNSCSKKGGAGYFRSGPLAIVNCSFTQNSAQSGGGIYRPEFIRNSNNHLQMTDLLTLINCILWENRSSGVDGHGLEANWKSIILQNAVEALYPGDPNEKETIYEPNLNILQGWDTDSRALNADPLFTDADNPIGQDEIWFTDDDGLRLSANSPAIDAGHDYSLPIDFSDLDRDGNLSENIPYDCLYRSRIAGLSVDVGPYEFEANPPSFTARNSVVLSSEFGGDVNGSGYYENGEIVAIQASAKSGYLFVEWTGDVSGSSNPLFLPIDNNKYIKAKFGLAKWVDVSSFPSATGSVSGGNVFVGSGGEVTIKASPLPGYLFSEWRGAATGNSNPLTITVDTNISITAIFIEDFFQSEKNEDLGYGWRQIPWFGAFFSAMDGWLYHKELGWIYAVTSRPEFWMFKDGLGWLWTSEKVWPHLWNYDTKSWIYFNPNKDYSYYHYEIATWIKSISLSAEKQWVDYKKVDNPKYDIIEYSQSLLNSGVLSYKIKNIYGGILPAVPGYTSTQSYYRPSGWSSDKFNWVSVE